MVVTVKFDGRLVLVTAIYLSIGIAALLLAFPGALIWIPSNSGEMAVWVQAVGSIAAIIATWWLTQRSYERQIEDREQDLQQRKLAYFKSVKAVLDDFKKAMNNLDEKLFELKAAPVQAMEARFTALTGVLQILFERESFNETDEILLRALAINAYTLEAIGEIYSDGFKRTKWQKNMDRGRQLSDLISRLDGLICGKSSLEHLDPLCYSTSATEDANALSGVNSSPATTSFSSR